MSTPVVSIVGRSKAGKTTFLEKLLKELARRGHKVAVIKNAHKSVNFDTLGKDSYRYVEAGAAASVVRTDERSAIFLPGAAKLSELTRLLDGDYDLVLTEGFKTEDAPKIEVRRAEAGPPVEGLKRLFAIVSDDEIDTRLRLFYTDDASGVADLLEKGFIEPQRQHLSVYVNRRLLTLRSFPRRFVSSVLLAMVSSLKGVAKISRLDIHLRRSDEDED